MLTGYDDRLARRPLLTQNISTAVLSATGGFIAQQGAEKKEFSNHEFARAARMAFYGVAIWRSAVSTWFAFLQHRIFFRNKNVERVARVAVDQTLSTSMSIMEGTSPADKLERSYTTALLRNCMVWPFVQLVNFRFVPLERRVVVVNVILLGWNCYFRCVDNDGATLTYESFDERVTWPSRISLIMKEGR
ncbi:sym-1 [Rhypophila decipiens]